MKKLPEHEEVYFRCYEELSYEDYGSEYIDLYERDNFLGAAFVNTEENGREFIYLNWQILQSDTIIKRNNEKT